MRRLLPVLLSCVLSMPCLAAEAPGGQPGAIPHPEVVAVRTAAPIAIDGALDEPVWQTAPAFTAFVQRDPVEYGTPSQRTEVRVAYDEDALYVGARMWDTHPDSILSRLGRRDVSVEADRFGVYLDSYLDRRSGYYFLVNAAGVQFDGTLMNDGWEDNSWDAVWSSKVRRDDQGWTCEMRIPFTQLRFNPSERHLWGIDFRRVIPRHAEEDYLAFQPRNGAGFVSRFGNLVGMQGIRTARSIEVLPYVTTKGEFLRHDSGDPFRTDPRYTPEGGADLRMSVGSRLTLNATVNPDFGQVEVDPAVVNLSDVESYFEEKRPFFVEGAQNFRFGNEGANDYWSFNWPEPTFFYSRRIGRSPQVDPPDADYVDVPVGTRILGAAKLTGKLSPSVNFGTLHALTGRELASLASGPARWDAEVEPLTYYGAARALREFENRQHGFGLMSTLAARRLDDATSRDALNRVSLVTGFDGWTFLDRKQTWVVSGWTAMSRIEGTVARMRALQEDPRHYLQRPDRSRFRLDPAATGLTGLGSRYWLNKQSGAALLNAGLGFQSPTFDVNDMGFQSRSDVINGHFGTGWQWTRNSPWRQYANVLGALYSSWDFDGNRIASGVWTSGRVNWANNWTSRVNFGASPRTLNGRRTRGGPLTFNSPGAETYAEFGSDVRRPVSWAANFNDYAEASGSYSWNANPTVTWRPVSSLGLSVGPGFERVRERAQWVGNFEDPAITATYGSRYVFADLDQKTLFASVRLDWAFDPRLCLQLYAQPLVSTGVYRDFKQLSRPRSSDYATFDPAAVARDGSRVAITPGDGGAPFAFDEPDFNVRSLRGNAVLRWEYMPGSTLYLVWTQQRSDQETIGDFGIGRSFRRLFDVKADNIFLAKVTYYFTR